MKAPENGKYKVSVKFLELGRAARLGSDLRTLALPHMRELWKEFDDTINLAVLDEGQICYLEVLESPHRFKFVASLGDRDPIHCTALGKAMAALLPDTEIKRILTERGMPRFTARTLTTYSQYRRELTAVREQGYAV